MKPESYWQEILPPGAPHGAGFPARFGVVRWQPILDGRCVVSVLRTPVIDLKAPL